MNFSMIVKCFSTATRGKGFSPFSRFPAEKLKKFKGLAAVFWSLWKTDADAKQKTTL
jgi:hypothetical protein